MEKNMKHIDNLFKEELGSHTETPPSAVWDALEKRLSEKRKKRAFPYRWFWYIGAVAFIVLLGASVLWKMKGGVSADAKMATVDNNVMGKKADVATTPASLNTNNNPATNNIAHNTPAKHHRNNKMAPATNKSGTERVATHTPKTVKKQSQAKATPNTSNKTDDELYADTDDDQYTVGYSSTRTNTAVENENTSASYTLEQRSQNNIRVAEMGPEQHIREAGYGNRPSMQITKQTLQNTITADRNITALSSGSSKYNKVYAENNTLKSTNLTPVHHRAHSHKAIVTDPVIAHNTGTEKIAVIRSSETSIHAAKKHKVRKAETPLVHVAAATPVIKSKTEKQLAVVVPAKVKENGSAKNIANRQNERKVKPAQIVVAATPLVNNKTEKQVAAIALPKENEQLNNTGKQTYRKKTHNHKTIAPTADNSIAAVTTSKNKPQSIAQVKQSETVVNASANSTTVAAAHSSDKKVAVVNKEKKTVHIPAKHNTNPGVNSGTAVAKNTATVKNKNRQNGPEKETISGNRNAKPIASNTVHKKAAKKPSVHLAKQQLAAQKDGQGNVSKDRNTGDNSILSVKQKAAKVKLVTDKHAETKEDKQVNTLAANIGIKKPAKGKHTPSVKTDKVPAEEIAVAKEKQINDPKTNNPYTAGIKAPSEQKPIAKTENKQGRKNSSKKGGKNTSNANNTIMPPPAPPVFVYNNSISKRNLEEETVIADNVRVNNFNGLHNDTLSNGGMIPATFKQENVNIPKPDSTVAVNTPDSSSKHHWFSKHFEAGVKGGYETGINRMAANKFVVSPYIQYNLGDKFAIMAQPSVKVSHLGNIGMGSPKSYIKTLSGSHSGVIDSGIFIWYGSSGGIAYTIEEELRKYNYTEQYDSIVKSNSLGRNYTEFEMPLLLKYKINKQLSVYGGVNIVYGKMIRIAENTYTSGPLTKSNVGVTIAPIGATAPTPPSVSSVIQFQDSLISTYKNPYPSPSGDLFRLGYMLGFSYEFKKRWLFDVLVQQATAKTNNEGGMNTNAALSLPYFRFTIGYKLTK